LGSENRKKLEKKPSHEPSRLWVTVFATFFDFFGKLPEKAGKIGKPVRRNFEK
jgi:hypothetical protein